jgi:hypothetical protein
MNIKSFTQADVFLGAKSDRRVPKIRSTSIHRIDDNTIAVKYHGTYVVTYHRDGRVILNGDGFRTSTTKERFNEFSNAQVFQRDFKWFVVDRSMTNTHVEFRDGMTVDILGYPATDDKGNAVVAGVR